jgi:hypothetical protein
MRIDVTFCDFSRSLNDLLIILLSAVLTKTPCPGERFAVTASKIILRVNVLCLLSISLSKPGNSSSRFCSSSVLCKPKADKSTIPPGTISCATETRASISMLTGGTMFEFV